MEQQEKIIDPGEREKELARRELRVDALMHLNKKGLPAEFADLLCYEDRDSCFASADTLEKLFREAVAKQVDRQLTGRGLRIPAQVNEEELSDREYYERRFAARFK